MRTQRTMEVLDEQRLVTACLKGDRQAFDLLWERYSTRVRTFLYHRTGDLEAADDLCQQVAIRMWGAFSRKRYDQGGALSGWIYTIARNVAKDWLGDRRRHPHWKVLPEDESAAAVGTSHTSRLSRKLLMERLFAEFDQILSEGEDPQNLSTPGGMRKMAFVLYYVDGATLPQIGAQLQVHARDCDLPAPTATQLNNWLRRGDILSKLICHLVEAHIDLLQEAVGRALTELDLDQGDRQIASLRWLEARTVEQISDELDLPPPAVEERLTQLRRPLRQWITTQAKRSLHRARHG